MEGFVKVAPDRRHNIHSIKLRMLQIHPYSDTFEPGQLNP